jgi:toxin ParE1/3/4
VLLGVFAVAALSSLTSSVPDFSEFTAGPDRKSEFFAFVHLLIESENARVLRQRQKLDMLDREDGIGWLDLFDICRFIATHDSVERADHVLNELETLRLNLAESPSRGHAPSELDRIGVTNYREIHFKPYRVIYEVTGVNIFVHCILDGRRDMPTLLERRLLR